ncbi:MAG TPA: dihydrofolate reductase family protein [Solirubrobacterales bacterium]|nr:dihydrofolate reductase family protein [Solirubrobacterales bacterium]
MGKLVVTEFVTVDGVFEDPGGSEEFERGGWAFLFSRGDEGDQFKLDETMDAEAQLLGRHTYEEFAKAWPSRDGDFADKFNSMPKYVVSKTLENPEWQNTTVIGGEDPAPEIAKLKEQIDGDILVAGSAKLVKFLLDEGLVDELRLMVFPIVLGRGRRLFLDHTAKNPLELVEVKPVGDDGVIVQIYRPRS